MLMFPPTNFRKRRRVTKTKATVPLVLQAAVYDPVGLTLTLTFDRAINISSMISAAIVVNDPVTNNRQYIPAGSSVMLTPAEVRFGLFFVGNASGSVTTLNAVSSNGIVALTDPGKWAGVSALALPYVS